MLIAKPFGHVNVFRWLANLDGIAGKESGEIGTYREYVSLKNVKIPVGTSQKNLAGLRLLRNLEDYLVGVLVRDGLLDLGEGQDGGHRQVRVCELPSTSIPLKPALAKRQAMHEVEGGESR